MDDLLIKHLEAARNQVAIARSYANYRFEQEHCYSAQTEVEEAIYDIKNNRDTVLTLTDRQMVGGYERL